MTTFPPKSPCPTCGSDLTLSAAPPVQMEAVAWRVGVPNNEYATLHEDVAEIARKHGYEVTPLYASPVPSPVQMEAVRSSCEVDWRASYIRARDALYQFQYPPDPKMLREIADEIDCGSDCEHGHTEWDTNSHVCSRSDRGECAGEKAWHLRQFADAIGARAEIVDPLAPPAQREEAADDLEPGELLPCPFCGGEAEILDFQEPDFDEEHENFGGSCVVCKKCQANTAVVFGYKETLHSSWNERSPPASPVPSSERDTGWLVELKGERPTWWSLTDKGEDAAGWVTDASLALRFARKCDADAYIDDMGWTDAFASEHIWSAP